MDRHFGERRQCHFDPC